MSNPTPQYHIPFPDTTEGSSRRPVTEEQVQELKGLVQGEVLVGSAPKFQEYTRTFNRGLKTPAQVIARPIDAADVSSTLQFCARHTLSPSVKSGGYGTHCWSIAGDIVIDLSGIGDIEFDTPGSGGEYVGLADRKGKGKGRAMGSAAGSTLAPVSVPVRRTRTREEAFGEEMEAAVSMSMEDMRSSNRRRVDSPEKEEDEDVPGPLPGNLASARRPSTSTLREMAPPPPSERIQTHVASQAQGSSSAASSSTHPYSVPVTFTSSSSAQPFDLDPSFPISAYLDPSGSSPPPPPLVYPLTYEHPYALITFGAGATQKQIDEYTSQNPLPATAADGTPCHVPYHIPFAAHPVGSTVMMLGGFGFATRLRGLSVDNLVEVEMVLADGKVVIVNERENTDLWWAVRGAGPAFGVAVRYVAKAWPCPVVFAGNLLYTFNPSTAPSLLKHYRDCVKSAPRELYANILLTAGPPGRGAILVIQMCFLGPRAQGLPFLEAISAWSGERCLLNEVDEKSYLDQQDSVAKVLRAAGGSGEGGEEGRSWFIRSDLAGTLTDEMIHKTVMAFAKTTDGCTWLFELAGGALTDFKTTCLPLAQREAAFTIVGFHKWPIVGADEDCIRQGEEWIHDIIGPNSTGGPWPCFAERCETLERVIGMFGKENWARLVDLKQQYDPSGLLRHCVWPLDREGKPIMSVDAEGRKRRFEDLPRARPVESGGEVIVDVSAPGPGDPPV